MDGIVNVRNVIWGIDRTEQMFYNDFNGGHKA